MPELSKLRSNARDVYSGAREFAGGLVHPTLRLGVTGLARSGKTVFITSLVRNLTQGGRLPFFSPLTEGRILGAYLEPQPDDRIPRFDYEGHLAALNSDPPFWPKSTKQISQLRLTVDYRPGDAWRYVSKRRSLHIDIVDYPGEWLLDLALMGKSFSKWSEESLKLARQQNRGGIASNWLSFLSEINPDTEMEEERVIEGAGLFRDYLRAARSEPHACSSLPPGRFLMPGDLEGSPMLTFFPLPPAAGVGSEPPSPLHKIMKRRYNSYLNHVVTPFYRDHFSRLDRQIVLVDALGALNAGPAALQDLERALTSILGSFRTGKNNLLSSIFRPRIDRILFAATKADHVHHSDHEKLAGLLRFMTERAIARAEYKGADVKVMAMAAIRATVEGMRGDGAAALPILSGIPLEGEVLGDKVFNGSEKAAIFPGDLPGDPSLALAQGRKDVSDKATMDMRYIRFRPPAGEESADKSSAVFPHIRLDHALDFLIGDRI